MDRGAWQAIVHGVIRSLTRLRDVHFLSLSDKFHKLLVEFFFFNEITFNLKINLEIVGFLTLVAQ